MSLLHIKITFKLKLELCELDYLMREEKMALTEPTQLDFNSLINQIDNGEIQIPQFQRDFVWTVQKSAKLIDSLLKGYPIGTFILWKTREKLRSVRHIGGIELPSIPEDDFSFQVLDGQQRLTSLYASVRGAKVDRDGKVDDFEKISIWLAADSNSDDQIVFAYPPEDHDPLDYISVHKLMTMRMRDAREYSEEYQDKIDDYKTLLNTFRFSAVIVKEAMIEVATEIFTRLNTGGKALSTFEIMVAKTYDSPREFDLAEQYQKLKNELDQNWCDLPTSVVLMTVGAIQDKVTTRKSLLSLEKDGFIESWPKAADGIKSAIDYFSSQFRIPVLKLLPYPHLIIPFAYFFHKHPDPPQDQKKEFLIDFFWRVAMSTWYSNSTDTRVESDLKKIDAILANSQPQYEKGVDISAEGIKKYGAFSAGRAWIKGILCLYAYQQPQSFNDGRIVLISNNWLKQVNSKNYHHFFPRAWMKKNLPNDPRANHIANITIVDDFLNKKKIRARAPSDYMTEYRTNNDMFSQIMMTHLIEPSSDGVYEDNFEVFFNNRCRRISDCLQKRIIPIDLDQVINEPVADEEEEV